MTGFQARVFSGAIDPEDLEIVRRIVVPTGQADVIDTAYYGDVRANYLITRNGDGTWRVEHLDTDSPLFTGVDTVRSIERLQFTDGTFNLANIGNLAAYGTINLSPLDPEQGAQIVATPAFNDPQGINADSIVYTWQSAPVAMDGTAEEDGDWAAVATAADATTFTPTEAEIGQRIRVVATFLDSAGALETIVSPATLAGGQRQRRADGARHRQHGAQRRRRPDGHGAERPRRHHDGSLQLSVAGWETARRSRTSPALLLRRSRPPMRKSVGSCGWWSPTPTTGVRQRWPCRLPLLRWSARLRPRRLRRLRRS